MGALAHRSQSRESSSKPEYRIVEVQPNFKEIEATRPDFDHSGNAIEVTKTPDPLWQYGQGVNDGGERLSKTHREIDLYAEDRPMVANYRLLISGIVPRPIGFLSTVSADRRTKNLAPFSYFQAVDHDPPMFIVGFSSRPERPKDTARNLKYHYPYLKTS